MKDTSLLLKSLVIKSFDFFKIQKKWFDFFKIQKNSKNAFSVSVTEVIKIWKLILIKIKIKKLKN